MAGGQAITSATGSLVAEGADGNQAVTGSESTAAAGTAGHARLLPLRSKKIGGGTASALLSGQAATSATGTLSQAKTFALTGRVATFAQGTVVYQGRVTIGWNANTEPDLAGYRVYHGTAPNVHTEFVTLGLVTSYVWNGLTAGVRHYFTVTAFDTSSNESAKSVEVSKQF